MQTWSVELSVVAEKNHVSPKAANTSDASLTDQDKKKSTMDLLCKAYIRKIKGHLYHVCVSVSVCVCFLESSSTLIRVNIWLGLWHVNE